jgi:serine-type D-Ala-D-Ala carboxypeptidase (penicillin-binding protein 5/6)
MLAVSAVLAVLVTGPVAASAQSSEPTIGAGAAIVLQGDADSVVSGQEQVLYARNPYERRPIASTTKLMTAYLAITHASAGHVLTVQPYTASPGETVAGLVPGQRLTVRDLLKAMLLPSGGDAAHTLAVDLAGSTSRFVGWMNLAARRLRLRHTHYATPVGLDTPGNYSSAGDLARLAMVLMRNQTVAGIVGEHSARLTDGQVVVNRNDLVGRYPFVVGIKTGHTSSAGYCLVGAARRGDAMVVSVALGDPSEGARDADTLALLRYGLGHLRPVEPLPPSQLDAPAPGRSAAGEDAGMIRS